MTTFEIGLFSCAVGFGTAAVTLLGLIASILRDSLKEFRKELRCNNRKIDIVAASVGLDLMELQNQAEKEI